MSAFATLYRVLLLAYPREFRAEHGDEASRLFADACVDDLKTAGSGAVLRRIARAMAEVPRAGFAERAGKWQQAGAAGAWQGLGADFRHAARSLRSRPALTLTIVLTLAVGLGTNVAVFSVIDATLLRPLPFPHANRVVFLQAIEASKSHGSDPRPSWARQWSSAHSLERTEWRVSRSVLVTGAGPATRIRIMDASGGYLNAIGARPILGRSLDVADSRSNAPRVAVLSQRFWRERFGASPEAIGALVTIDGVAHRIVGVASDLESDIAGLTFSLATALHDDDDRELVRTVAWLRPGVTLAAAQAELDTAGLIDIEGRAIRPKLSVATNILWTSPEFRATEFGLIAAALLVLAIAGVNVWHLFLTAGQERAAELTVRRALGAGTGRLARLLFVEAMTLASAVSAIGLALAWALVRWLTSLGTMPQFQGRLDSIHLDPVIGTFAVGLGCFAAMAFGLWPAIRSARQSSLAAGDGSTRFSRRRRLSSSMLMALETGLCAALLIVASVVGHAFVSMQLVPRGFDADRILGIRLTLPADRYSTPASRAAFFDRLEAKAVSIPGVERVGLGYGAVPSESFTETGKLSIAGAAMEPVDANIEMAFVSPGHLALMGIPLLQGADFGPADLAAAGAVGENAAPQPAIISRSLANAYWPDGGAVGAMFQIADRRSLRRFHVIGVAGDVSVWRLLNLACHDCEPYIYLPLPAQRMFTDVLLRLRPGAAAPTAALQAAVATLDPDVPADDELRTGAARLSEFISQPRFTAALFTVFACIALVLVAIGLSTIVSRSVAQRTREMGIRMALGATPASVRVLVVGEGLRPALIGLAAGVAAALGITRAIRSTLYGMSPADPLSLTLAPALLAVIVIAALALPAARATRVDPARTLRAD